MNAVKMSLLVALAVITTISAPSSSFADAAAPKLACRLDFANTYGTSAPAEVILEGPMFLRGACDDTAEGQSVVVPYQANFRLPNLTFAGSANLTINCGKGGSIQEGLTFRFEKEGKQFSFSFDRNNLWDTEDMLMYPHLVQTSPSKVVLNDVAECSTNSASCLTCMLSE